MPKQLLLLLLLVFAVRETHAQRETETESARHVAGDTAMVNALIERSYTFRSSNPGMATEYCLSAIRIAKELRYRKGEARALGSLGYIYYSTGNYVDAVEICYEALLISEQLNDKYEMARSHANVGGLDYQQKHPARALEHFRKALALATEVHDDRTIARCLNSIAGMYQMTLMPLTDSSFAYAERALAISRKGGDHFNYSVSNHILGDLYLQEKKYEAAIGYFNKCLEVSDEISVSLRIDTRNQIAECYLNLKEYGEAFKTLQLASTLAEQSHSRIQLSNSFRLYSRLYKEKGDYSKALMYQEQFADLQDSLRRVEINNKIATTQTQSDLDIKQAQIELLTKDTLINKDEINRQRTQLYTMIGGFIGILFLAGVLVFSYQKIERTNVLLKQRTAELARINATKDKLFSIISHDFRSPLNSLKGLLSLVENQNLTREEFAMLAEKLRKNFNAVSNDLENLLQWSMAQLQGIQTNSVKIDVQPIVDEHITVFQELAKAKNVNITNKIKNGLFGIADEDHIRLVLRNLISNAIKFTPPGGTVEISGYQESPFITIKVTDTGVGIASEHIQTLFHKDRSVSTRGTNQEKGVGLGLMLCAEFVETNGGQLNVASQLGKGSVFSFTLKTA